MWGALLLLAAAGELSGAGCFAQLPAGVRAGPHFPGRTASRQRVLRRAGVEGGLEGYSYKPFGWMLDFGVSDQQLQDVMERVPGIDSVWPDPSQSLTRDAFRKFVKGGSSGRPLDDRAIDSVFNSFGGLSGALVPNFRDEVAGNIGSWRASPGGGVDPGAVQGGILSARLQVLGAWLFLNVFSAYAGYFVIGRPILYQLTGIDLLPNLVRFWEAQ